MFLLASLVSLVLSQCTTVRRNVEWRSMPEPEQLAYLKAVQCIRDAPSKLNITGPETPTTMYEDLEYAHFQGGKNPVSSIHGTPQFLPWHRAFLKAHDDLLVNVCGYTGKFPYWDWTVHASNGLENLGFTDGIVHPTGMGLFNSSFPDVHDIYRDAYAVTYQLAFQDDIDYYMAETDYNSFEFAVEAGVHSRVHQELMGEMRKIESSPNDLIFFLHHRNVDRIWHMWQQKSSSLATDYNGEVNGKPVSIKDELLFYGVGLDTTVENVLDAEKMCVVYETSIPQIPEASSNFVAKKSIRSLDPSFIAEWHLDLEKVRKLEEKMVNFKKN